ncbi:type III polyketide synthase [Pseudonocardia nigra]|uniref:type III polyketide synthase n=1 Tax=Pseudonocardia nigra TaxID=1921578 RepID=UPI001C5E2D1E|nr:3-oxoacyl-[acyl-carrier-protein] synthase III C-terminal domain-containing protein [Pseudonocardia nigra]
MGVSAYVAGFGAAFPGGGLDQDRMWQGYFANHFAGDRLAERIFRSAGVRRRHAAVNPLVEDAARWSTGDRMRRYIAEALPLGKEAVGAALADAGLRADEVGMFAVVSCTGYTTPGLDIRVAADLGMAADVQRLLVGHMGCYAAIPGLGAVADHVAARGRPAVALCLELTSLHVQPPTADRDQVVAHALFGDAAAAVVVLPGKPRAGLEVVDVAALTDAATADRMTWDVTDLGFRMGLSPEVPGVLARHVAGMVSGLLDRHGLTVADVDAWAVHPGGPRILDTVADRLDLPDGALDASHDVLAERGNCSSATVLLVLDALRARGRPRPGRAAVAMAFGPGLTLYAALLRGT